MAETSYLWDNPGTGDSPALGYGNSLLNQVILRMLLNGTGDQGVLLGWRNDLEVTDGGGLNAAVDTGGAISYGVWYESDAATNVAIANNATEWVVVRASWATQTARLTAIAPGGFTQNPGVTYDIPLAQVTTVAGAITLITDTRDYCTFSTEVWPFGVIEDMIAADAVTIAKVIDQDRYFVRGAGAFAPDGTNPAAWSSLLTIVPRRDDWLFVDAATNAVWCTIRVPEDITSANLDIIIEAAPDGNFTGDVRWLYNIWQAASGGVAANSTGNVVATYSLPTVFAPQEDTLVSQPVTAGDLIHFSVSRDGAHAADTLAASCEFFGLRFEYTADS